MFISVRHTRRKKLRGRGGRCESLSASIQADRDTDITRRSPGARNERVEASDDAPMIARAVLDRCATHPLTDKDFHWEGAMMRSGCAKRSGS